MIWCRSAFLVLVSLLSPAPVPGQSDWKTLRDRAELLLKSGDLTGAELAARKVVNVAPGPAERAEALDFLGYTRVYLGRHAEAGQALFESRKIYAELGRESTGYAKLLGNIALLYRQQRRLEEALAAATECAAMYERLDGRLTAAYAGAIGLVGSIRYLRGEYAPAEEAFTEGLAIYERVLPQSSPTDEYATFCSDFANLTQRMGKYQMAAELFEKAEAAFRISLGASHPSFAIAVAGAAFLQMDLGNYEAAEKKFAEALPVLQHRLGETSAPVAAVLNNQAVLYQTVGNFDAAEAAYLRTLDIKRSGEKTSYALTLRNYGRVVYRRDPARALEMYRQALNIFDQTPDPPAFELASTLITIGEAELARARFDEAGEALERALLSVEKAFGPSHPLYSVILNWLGVLAQARGNQEAAEEHFKRGIEVMAAAKRRNHPELVRHVVRLARLYASRKDYQRAFPLFRQAAAIRAVVDRQLLGVGSEAAKSAMLSRQDDLIAALIDLQRNENFSAAEARALAFETVTHSKARVIAFIREWRANLREQADQPTRRQLVEWEALVDCQVSLAVAIGYRDWRHPLAANCTVPGDRSDQYQLLAEELRRGWTADRGKRAAVAIADLETRSLRIEEQLSRKLPAFRQVVEPENAGAIRSALGSDELLIEIVAYDAAEQGTHSDMQYGAFLVGRESGIEWVEFGPAGPIDRAITDLLRAADDWSLSLSLRETSAAAVASTTASNALGELSKGPLAPLGKSLSEKPDIRRLRIAPDSMLLLLPFEALSLDKRPFLERYTVSYLLAGRELLDSPKPAAPGGAPLIAASPGFASRRTLNALRADQFEWLPGALREARAIGALSPGSQVLSLRQATEERLKHINSPAFLHVAGHGAVRGASLGNLNSPSSVMNLSGIFLEESYGRARSSEDGFLSARELRNLDLRDTEMVVLSQCRMAGGLPVSGDGIYGMRRAALLAGARTFIAPLWNVEDGAQVRLMTEFYRALASGRDRAEAMGQAKLKLLSDPATSHPLFWAPTILSGSTGPLASAIFKRNAARH